MTSSSGNSECTKPSFLTVLSNEKSTVLYGVSHGDVRVYPT
jgi:hypothetical protein